MVAGLVSELPDKNCWTLSEHAGHDTPDAVQHLLSRGTCDAEGVRDDLRGYVVEQLGDTDAILVVDESGDPKKGARPPSACNASAPAPQDVSRTPRWQCF